MPEPKFTADELHKLHLGNLMVQIINLQAEIERLAVENDALKQELDNLKSKSSKG